MKLDDLISPEYLGMNRALHAGPRGFGNSGRKHAQELIAMCSVLRVRSILDYGAGGGTLKKAMEAQAWPGTITEYDPAIDGINALPSAADLVTCTDVLEHIEPEKLQDVLEHIHRLSRRASYLTISTQASHKILRDGRNAHLIVEPPAWWLAKIEHIGWKVLSTFIRRNDEGIAEIVLWLNP